LSAKYSDDIEERKKLKDENIGYNGCHGYNDIATGGQCLDAADLRRQDKGDRHENN